MDNAFKLGQMKAAIREAMPPGAGDFTVTQIAQSALRCALLWEQSRIIPETIRICPKRDAECPYSDPKDCEGDCGSHC